MPRSCLRHDPIAVTGCPAGVSVSGGRQRCILEQQGASRQSVGRGLWQQRAAGFPIARGRDRCICQRPRGSES